MRDAIGERMVALERVAREAGTRALAHWHRREELVFEQKADPRDIVSVADREVEAAIRDAVAAAFPEDGFIGEEFGTEPTRSGFAWVIDPIDGTAPFMAGLPSWCVSIALVRGEERVGGAVAEPVAGELYLAEKGRGATLDGRRLRLDPGAGIRSGSTAVGASHRSDPGEIAGVVERLMRRGGMFYRNGSGALMLAYVAAGKLVGIYEPHMNAYDCLAGLLLVEEAGGIVAPYPERDLAGGGRILAAAPGAWADLVEIVGEA